MTTEEMTAFIQQHITQGGGKWILSRIDLEVDEDKRQAFSHVLENPWYETEWDGTVQAYTIRPA